MQVLDLLNRGGFDNYTFVLVSNSKEKVSCLMVLKVTFMAACLAYTLVSRSCSTLTSAQQ